MLWKWSKAESEVISEASKQTKNSQLHSGKNRRVGESLQKTFILHSLFLNLQVWSTYKQSLQQLSQVAKEDADRLLERHRSQFSSWSKEMAEGMWFPRQLHGCKPEEMLLQMLQAGSWPQPLHLPAQPLSPKSPPAFAGAETVES